MSNPLAVGLDLGSTRIKAALMQADGRLTDLRYTEAPLLDGKDPVCEGDAEAYVAAAENLLLQVVEGLGREGPVAVAAQRSSFLLWEKTSGGPVTPLISWQDRRAGSWCKAHRETYDSLNSATGLPLSPHYAGPKLAVLFSESSRLKSRATAGEVLFGTLETYMIWRMTGGRIHRTDFSMAARTLMADVQKGAWDPQLLGFFGIPANILPDIGPSAGVKIPFPGGSHFAASVSDQAAGLLTLLSGAGLPSLGISLGTGGFVMADLGDRIFYHSDYLTTPVLSFQDGDRRYALEGTINAIGPALSMYPGASAEMNETDPFPELYCLPDSTGVGAPYWQAEQGMRFSEPVGRIPPEAARRAVMEGIIFRVCRILEDFHKINNFRQLRVSGGLSSEPFIVQGLAACSGFPVCVVGEKEATLWGACRLAAQKKVHPPDATPVELPKGSGGYLKTKYIRWRIWVERILRYS